MSKKKILFLSKDNLTSNPRLFKELKFAVELGHQVDFVGFYNGNWSDKIDTEIRKKLNANFHYISATRKPPVKWLYATARERGAKIMQSLGNDNLKTNAFAHSKRTALLCDYLNDVNKKYDLIAAHTLPTLYPAFQLAKRTDGKFSFDIEDYHPGEALPGNNQDEIDRRKFLMSKILPHASYISYASPLIGEKSLELLPDFPEKKHGLINNCFSETEFEFKENNSEKMQFVWFSQNIAGGRGLELILPALNKFKDKAELHLIGNLYNDFYQNVLSNYKELVKTHKPLSQKKLNLKLSEFDVGLAMELNSADYNRSICLTNKIWAYLQSGLYILATDTPAQVKFLKKHSANGQICRQSTDAFTLCFETLIKNRDLIRSSKQIRYNYGKSLSWEKERKKLAHIK